MVPRPEVVLFTPYAGPMLTGAGSTGGAETQLVLLSHALHARGRRAALAVYDAPGGLPASVDGVQIIALPGPARGSSRARLVIAVLRDVDADVIVQRAAGSYTGVVGLASRLRGRRFVYSCASDLEFDGSFLAHDRAARRLFPVGLRCTHAIVVQTNAQAEMCRTAWRRDCTVIRSIAETVPPRTQTPEAFVWIGRMADYKRPGAFAELASRLPQARFWMIGEPSKSIRARASALPNLELLSARPRAEVMALLDRAVAVVSTSVKEGMPNVFLEGWARGVPALALAHDPDGIIERHGLGFVAANSLDRLADIAAAAWSSRGDQAAAAARCRDYVAREHTADGAAQRWERVLGLSPAPGA